MNASTRRRLDALEATDSDQAKQLPEVVPDSTTDTELARRRQHGREVYRESDPAFLDAFV
jgi:hypothetical protein